jgi:hypothetical protein
VARGKGSLEQFRDEQPSGHEGQVEKKNVNGPQCSQFCHTAVKPHVIENGVLKTQPDHKKKLSRQLNSSSHCSLKSSNSQHPYTNKQRSPVHFRVTETTVKA